MRQDTFAILPNLHVGWVVVLFFGIFLVWGAVLTWRWSTTRSDAARVYAARMEQGALAEHVTQDAFENAYLQSEAPRGATYFFAAALLVGLVVPPVMMVFSRLWFEIWTLAGRWPPTAPGTMVHTFGMFLAMMAAMIAIAAFAMRRYHMRTPLNLRQAIDALNKACSNKDTA
ncbi:MAG: hypothetical protein AAGJ32_06665 [Pseudomonadota bacterium]